jgi:hypothetical protein
VIANVNRDTDRKPEPFTAADFMPGAKSEEDEMREFVEKVQRGESFEVDPEEAAAFRRTMAATFGNLKPGTIHSSPSIEGGKREVFTNAIAGEPPRRGLV